MVNINCKYYQRYNGLSHDKCVCQERLDTFSWLKNNIGSGRICKHLFIGEPLPITCEYQKQYPKPKPPKGRSGQTNLKGNN